MFFFFVFCFLKFFSRSEKLAQVGTGSTPNWFAAVLTDGRHLYLFSFILSFFLHSFPFVFLPFVIFCFFFFSIFIPSFSSLFLLFRFISSFFFICVFFFLSFLLRLFLCLFHFCFHLRFFLLLFDQRARKEKRVYWWKLSWASGGLNRRKS